MLQLNTHASCSLSLSRLTSRFNAPFINSTQYATRKTSRRVFSIRIKNTEEKYSNKLKRRSRIFSSFLYSSLNELLKFAIIKCHKSEEDCLALERHHLALDRLPPHSLRSAPLRMRREEKEERALKSPSRPFRFVFLFYFISHPIAEVKVRRRRASFFFFPATTLCC